MTTLKKTSKKRIPLDLTLVALGAKFDAALGRRTRLAELVHDYRHYSDVAAAHGTASEHRIAIRAALARAASRGETRIGDKVLDRYVTGGGEKRVLRSAPVKTVNERLWEESRVDTMRVSLTAPTKSMFLLPKQFGSGPTAWAALESSWEASREARAAVADARSGLAAVFTSLTTAGLWDGRPEITADGWDVGWKSIPTFNAKECRAVIERQCLDLQKYETIEQVAESIRYRLVGVDGSGIVDLDGD